MPPVCFTQVTIVRQVITNSLLWGSVCMFEPFWALCIRNVLTELPTTVLGVGCGK